ncbi:hypothetical protein M5K25_021565 [Dendrobium thyrsiflorum]|uniref:Uncharacterized protein n=1 Tax=Dendrobium thyrsiflorum TaxID=117978 RepID=A0ABD0UD55_DENTH
MSRSLSIASEETCSLDKNNGFAATMCIANEEPTFLRDSNEALLSSASIFIWQFQEQQLQDLYGFLIPFVAFALQLVSSKMNLKYNNQEDILLKFTRQALTSIIRTNYQQQSVFNSNITKINISSVILVIPVLVQRSRRILSGKVMFLLAQACWTLEAVEQGRRTERPRTTPKVPKLSLEHRKTVPGTPKTSDLTLSGPKSGPEVDRGGLPAAGRRSAGGAAGAQSARVGARVWPAWAALGPRKRPAWAWPTRALARLESGESPSTGRSPAPQKSGDRQKSDDRRKFSVGCNSDDGQKSGDGCKNNVGKKFYVGVTEVRRPEEVQRWIDVRQKSDDRQRSDDGRKSGLRGRSPVTGESPVSDENPFTSRSPDGKHYEQKKNPIHSFGRTSRSSFSFAIRDSWVRFLSPSPPLAVASSRRRLLFRKAKGELKLPSPAQTNLENEGDVGDIIGLDQSDAFGFEHFGEARPGDSTYVDRFDDANLGDL